MVIMDFDARASRAQCGRRAPLTYLAIEENE